MSFILASWQQKFTFNPNFLHPVPSLTLNDILLRTRYIPEVISYKQPQKVKDQPLCLLKFVVFKGNIHQTGCDGTTSSFHK